MKKMLSSIVVTLFAAALHGQQLRLNVVGVIEYQKSVNTYAVLKKMIGGNAQGVTQQISDEFQKNHLQFLVEKSSLAFDGDETIFTPDDSEGIQTFFGSIPLTEQNNVVYRKISKRELISSRKFYEKRLIVKDSVTNIKWKLTDEKREICGYTCRRANALILDSIYVVAFYTSDIQVSSGPESFGGLPGMILEVALPHDNVIWKATKVDLYNALSDKINPPIEGTPISEQGYRNMVVTRLQSSTNRKKARIELIDFLL